MTLPRPIPAAGEEAYRLELAARLAHSPACASNYRRYLASRRTCAKVDYLPVKLDIENASRCNFACSMCAVSNWDKGRRAPDMELPHFLALLEEQVGLVEIKLNGIGEPLMQGEDYFAMVRAARERRIWVRMTTNASLLHLGRPAPNYKRLIDSGVNEIDISIDGADAATFEGIRIQSDFSRVKENCKTLNRYAHAHGRPGAKMWTLVQKGNVAGLENHVRLAAWLEFRHLVFSLQLHGWGDDALAARNRAQMVQVPEERLHALVALGKELNVRVAFWDVAEKFSTVSRETLCPWPFERAVVTSDLRTVPCCMIGDPDQFELGKGLPFGQAWQGNEYVAFRQAHLDGTVPQVCKGCYQ